ncbi:MAG: chorismate-binding protein, partial [Conexibacteraceae bacterium]|nr:chorismate-binding protein [Conexibacteraceae bacterium]
MIIGTRSFLADRAAPPAAELWRVRLPWSAEPAQVLAALEGEPYLCCLSGAWAGGGAIIASEPLRVADPHDDPFALLDELPAVGGASEAISARYRRDTGSDITPKSPPEGVLTPPGPVGTSDGPSPVGGGWFGWLGYRLAERVEDVPLAAARPVPLPDFHLAYYDHLVRQDAHGFWWFEALATEERRAELEERLEHLRRRVADARFSAFTPGPEPQRPRATALRLHADVAEHHLWAVAECRERIAAGEIFQANICLRLEGEYEGSATALMCAALEREREPGAGPAGVYWAAFDTPRGGIVSLSPELFLRRRGRRVRSGPIKGTVQRPADPVRAAAALERLRASGKDAAEHVMIVDLMRNNIGRVCEYGSVTAPRRATAQAGPGLWHLVTNVEGHLRPDIGDAQLLRATFPPGS